MGYTKDAGLTCACSLDYKVSWQHKEEDELVSSMLRHGVRY